MARKRKYIYKIDEIPFTPLVEDQGIVAQLFLSDNMQISFLQNPPGADFPEHSHAAEQVLIMLEGSEEHILDGEIIHMEAGDICFHPSNMPHGGKTITGFKGIDIFFPQRTEKGGHVDRMRQYGTMPDDQGNYPKNTVQTPLAPWFMALLDSLKKK